VRESAAREVLVSREANEIERNAARSVMPETLRVSEPEDEHRESPSG